MKREILFKAKRVDGRGWVFGNLVVEMKGVSILSFNSVKYTVFPETVCQFTGLLDKNGNKIFEGDNGFLILKGIGKGECSIEFENGGFVINAHGQPKKMPLALFDSNYHEIEITGNIHDKQAA